MTILNKEERFKHMQEIKVFENEEFGAVRTVEIDGNPYFVGKDVADILGYQNGSRDVNRHVDEEDRQKVMIFDGNQDKETIIINESGLYSLVLSSKLASAKRFKRWVTSEVIPSIRKNGGYIANQEHLTPEQIVANALVIAQNIINEKNRQIQEMAPKAEFFDAVADSKDAIEIGQVAKVLDYPGIGRNKLFGILRRKRILMGNNIPYQKYIDCGYFRTIEQKYSMPDGETRISIKTLVYQKGVDYIRKVLSSAY